MEIKHLGKSFGQKVIFEDLNLSFPKQGTVRIMAESGRGKTTLLRIIAGLEQTDSGEVTGAGRVSMVFQENRLLPEEGALVNAAIGAELPGKASVILDELGLEADKDTRADKLSGGMARRVAIARALSREADTYLFDEPMQGLDEKTARKTLNVIKKYTEGKLLIYVTHNEDELKEAYTLRL